MYVIADYTYAYVKQSMSNHIIKMHSFQEISLYRDLKPNSSVSEAAAMTIAPRLQTDFSNPAIQGIVFTFLFLRGCPGWGANPGPLDFIYFLIFHLLTAEPQRLPIVFTFLCSDQP
jgi:hypothetical protein